MPASSIARLCGGKGANQAVALARLGADVAMVGVVGDDAEGRTLRASLASEGVDVSSIVTAAGVPSGLAVVVVDSAGENAIVVVPGANASLDPDRVRAASAAIGSADAVLLQLEIPMPAVAEASRVGRASGARVVLNAAPAMPLSREVLAAVDVLIVNASEACTVSGRGDVASAAAALREMGPSEVVVTLGPEGSLVTVDAPVDVPAFDVQPVDTSGAGDCFAAAFTWARSGGSDAAAAARFASAAAAISVTRPGAQSMPTAAEVEDFLSTR